MVARLRRTARSLEEASADLGADTWQTFRHVTFPQLGTALLAGALLAFALSFDEVIVTTFTAGAEQTLPIWISRNLSRPNQLPIINVVASVVILISIIPVYFAQRLTQEPRGIGGGRAPAGPERRKLQARQRRPLEHDDHETPDLRRRRVDRRRRGRDHGGAEPGHRRGDRRGAAVQRRGRRPRRRGREGGARRSGSRRPRASAPSCCSSSRTSIDEHAEELAQLESQNVGKPIAAARDEPPVMADNLRFFAGAARLLEGKAAGEYMREHTSWIRREPIGVVAGITPWNYPLMMAIWKLAPALAAGNVQVLKPAEQTPLTTAALRRSSRRTCSRRAC